MDFVEGTYRLPDREWQVLICTRDSATMVPKFNASARWGSGVTGTSIKWPEHQRLNKQAVLKVLLEQFGVAEWVEVRGPDSMQLR